MLIKRESSFIMNDSKIWLNRAKSSLELAKAEKTESIYYEDLCYQAQQASEKALKALFIFYELKIIKTHNFFLLLSKIKEMVDIPDDIKEVTELNIFASRTRYPGDYVPVSENEYKEALEISQKVVDWVNKIISGT